MSDVAIVGIGMHEFGRTDGVSGMDQGVVAVRRALADCGAAVVRHGVRLRWVDGVWGGRHDGQPRRAHRLAVHQRAQRLRHRRHRAQRQAVMHHPIRHAFDMGMASASTSTSAAPSGSTRRPASLGKDWYGDIGLALTTAVLRDEDQPLHARVRHQPADTLAKVAVKAFRNGAKNPMAWRRKPLSEQEILDSAMLSNPLTQYMFCSPGEGGVAMILCRADKAKQYTDQPRSTSRPQRRPHAQVRFLRGARSLHRHRTRRRPHRADASTGCLRDGRHRPRRGRRRPTAGHRIRRRGHAHGRERLLRARRAGAR